MSVGDVTVWERRVALRPLGLVVTIGCVALMLAAAIAAWMAEVDSAALVIVVAATVIVALLVVPIIAFRVRVDARGLRATSLAGWPIFSVPVDDIALVEVDDDVHPVGEFGGWGVRWRPGRFGVVLRTGEGIRVVRSSGKVFVVTVDDAATGAALLKAHVERASNED